METPIHQHPSPLFSLEEAAAKLGLPPSNLLLWEMHYGDLLDLPRDPFGQLLFSQEDIRTLRDIDRWIRCENRSPGEVRRRLRGSHRACATRATGLNGTPMRRKAPPTDDWAATREWIEPAPRASTEPPRSTAPPSPPPPSEAFLASLDHLREDVGYLLDENRALQELVGRLVAYIEEMAKKLPSPAERGSKVAPPRAAPVRQEQISDVVNGQIAPVDAASARKSTQEGPKHVKAWVPRSLEESESI